jgi:putative lipoprotein (rSAM/lipoprotein system)
MAKRIYRPLTKGVNWVLAGILSVLGFSGCNKEEFGPDEYGTPYASYTFRGQVTNEAGNTVKNIKIEIMEGQSGYYNAIQNPILSNDDGSYYVSIETFPTDEFRIVFSDIDGTTNGSYQNDTIPVKINKGDYSEGNGNWNYGSVEKEINQVLKEKE